MKNSAVKIFIPVLAALSLLTSVSCSKKNPNVLEMGEVNLAAPVETDENAVFKGKCKDPSKRVSQIDVRYEPKDASAWVRVRLAPDGLVDAGAKDEFGFTVLKLGGKIRKIDFGEDRKRIWESK